MPDTYPYEVPEGFQEGMSGGSYNPDTRERTSFALPPHRANPPPQPTDIGGMEGINREAVNRLFQEQPADVAMKAIEAAVQFQGLRGYQQAIKNGEAPEKALVKYGPMIFNKQAGAFGPSMKAITPPPNAVWSPATNGAPGAFTMPGHMPLVPQPTGPKPSDILAREKFDWMKAHPKANPEDYETIHFPGTKPIEGLPAVPGEVRSFLGIDALAKDKPAQPAIPGVPGTPSRTRKVLISKPSSEAASDEGPSEAAPLATPASPKFKSADEVRAAYKSKSIDRDTAKKILADQFNLK